jgi:DNA-binding NtrC family response regulator
VDNSRGGDVVLIVEDDDDCREAIGAAVANLGRRPVLAGSYDEAIAVLRKSTRLKTIVTDLNLGPGDDGITVLQQARQLQPASNRILMSGSKPEARITSALFEGLVDRFVAKPVELSELRALLWLGSPRDQETHRRGTWK